jgi:acetyltransferase-like isoleucine patch superfamily enzyme
VMLARIVRTIIDDTRVVYLRSRGISIGKDCFISWGAKLDTCAGTIIIGDRCEITYGSIILSHDATDRKIDRRRGGVRTVRLGNDVFIGVNSVVLGNVTIGDNSIIGAGSIVTRDVPANVVVAGNPARIIRTLGER